jgi:hypothetical protein
LTDYKLPALAAIGLDYQSLLNHLKTGEIKEVARSFNGNVDRVVSAGKLPVRLLNLGQHFQPTWLRARHRIVGDRQLSGKEYLEAAPKIAKECMNILDEQDKIIGGHGLPKMLTPRWLEALEGPSDGNRRESPPRFTPGAVPSVVST